MGICWSRIAGKSNPGPASIPSAPPPVTHPIPDSDPLPSSIGHLIDGDTSFLGSNVSGTSWFSMLTTNFSARLSQASGKIAAIWGNNATEENEFPAAMEDENLPDVGTSPDSQLRSFTFAQLKSATFNFRNDMVLGRGGFGSVYKGWIKETTSQGVKKRPIAVKRLDANSKQGFRQWRTEVGFLGRLSHPNIVKLVGYCKENENFLIVYEFMQKGSLNYYLFANSSNRLLSWETRVNIMIGMARGLAYLHMMEKPIIYRDFKSSNVLLDQSYTAKISDFGLAKWGPTAGNSSVTGHVMGTVGYAAPEYVATGNLYVKSDVYSFGVVLIEMLTGLRAIDKKRPPWEQNLLEWVKPALVNKRRLRSIMDSRLEGKYSAKEAEQIAQLAVRCLNPGPTSRPSMKEVEETLQHVGERYAIDEA
ncbi:probable serine/threonine-protein kinase PIX13 [Manihot esculenta]|uniref:non-specific serine/threonine protein kinase n=1 Tax=Manihot esculenta TaxID=3983 RepID=A0A2C9WFQ5_MANES|nr:probable serine/threonine-protein kinase PIX13 [Manihot esculenta]OAY58742.1 hypothetical protein MANES_02G203500v8 [Manihot esculenta]